MSEWKPEIVQIEKITKHPNADSLEIATVLTDYPVITKLGQYKIDDLVGYIPIDTIVPDTEQFFFLCPLQKEKYEEGEEIKEKIIGPKYLVGNVPEKYRKIKAKKIRGIYSQGILIEAPLGLNLGDSLTDILGLKKWEEEEEDNLPSIKSKGANAAKPPEGWSIPHYDIEGLRKYLNCFNEDEEVVVSEKLHGCNASFCYDGDKLWTKSRNYYKKEDPDDMWIEAGIRFNLKEKLSKFPMMTFFCELIGNVKNFRYNAEVSGGKLNTRLYFFDIWDVKNMRWLDYDNFCSIIDELGLERVPELYRGKWQKELIYSLAEGLTTLGARHTREGCVVKTTSNRYEPRLDSRLILKLVGQGYNLSK